MDRYIPKYLNALPQILWWEFDEFTVFLLFVGIGIIADHQFIGSAIGLIAWRIYSKINNTSQPGFIKHIAYKYGMWGMKGKVPEFWVKELVR